MKRAFFIFFIVLWLFLCLPAYAATYDQSSPLATAQSYILALLNGDTAAITYMTKDVIPWYYYVSDLLAHSTNVMAGSSLQDFCYFESDKNTIVIYNKKVTPSPDVDDFYCMAFVRGDGKYYISELRLPKSDRGIYEYIWDARCKAALSKTAITVTAPSSTSTPAIPEWQKVWNSIDKKMRIIDLSLDSDPQYLFEDFVKEYRNHSYHRAWTAVLSSSEILNELPSALMKTIEGSVQDLCNLFNSDTKVANLVIEYLAGNDFSERYKAQEGIDAASEIITIEGELHSNIEKALDFSAVSNLKIFSTKHNRQLKLSDVMCITYDNFDDVYHKIMAIRNPSDGTVDLSHPSIIANMYIDAPTKLGNKVQEKLGKRIVEEHGSDSFETKTEILTENKILKGIEIFTYLVEPVFSGYGAYVEFKKYEAVLNQYEEELQSILVCSKSKNTDQIVETVMNILTETVADGIVLTIEKNIFADTAVATGELLLDISCLPLAVINIEGAILQLAANTSETFGKVWGLEDLYEEFQTCESTLLQSIKAFHSNPSDITYHDLKASHQYYSIIVNSGANAVSNILISDAEAGINKLKNWVGQIFSGNKSDIRIEQIEYGKKIPVEDAKTLSTVSKLIFGQ